MSYTTRGEEIEKYNEKIKLGLALKVVDCDVFYMEIHYRLTKLGEENKKLHEGLRYLIQRYLKPRNLFQRSKSTNTNQKIPLTRIKI